AAGGILLARPAPAHPPRRRAGAGFLRMVAGREKRAARFIGGWRTRRAAASGSMARRAAGICMASLPEPQPAYAELQITSNFSFLRGASHPEELAIAAAALGLAGFALIDRNSLAGVVRAHDRAKKVGVPFIVGSRLDFRCG